jgi:hypothetical protein
MALRTRDETSILEDGLAADFNFTQSKCYKFRFIMVSLLLTVLVLIGFALRVLSYLGVLYLLYMLYFKLSCV